MSQLSWHGAAQAVAALQVRRSPVVFHPESCTSPVLTGFAQGLTRQQQCITLSSRTLNFECSAQTAAHVRLDRCRSIGAYAAWRHADAHEAHDSKYNPPLLPVCSVCASAQATSAWLADRSPRMVCVRVQICGGANQAACFHRKGFLVWTAHLGGALMSVQQQMMSGVVAATRTSAAGPYEYRRTTCK